MINNLLVFRYLSVNKLPMFQKSFVLSFFILECKVTIYRQALQDVGLNCEVKIICTLII